MSSFIDGRHWHRLVAPPEPEISYCERRAVRSAKLRASIDRLIEEEGIEPLLVALIDRFREQSELHPSATALRWGILSEAIRSARDIFIGGHPARQEID